MSKDRVVLERARQLAELRASTAQTVLANEELGDLIRANQRIIGDLLMPMVLRRVAEAACRIAGARGCAMLLRAEQGELREAVGYGLDAVELASLKLLVGDHAGTPTGYVSVEIETTKRRFGTIYLTIDAATTPGSTTSESLRALARTAAVAIDNAELFDQSRHRQHWLQSSTEIFRQLLSGSAERHLALITSRARDIADADAVTLGLVGSDGRSIDIRVTAGREAEGLVGWNIPLEGSLSGRVVASGEAVLLEDFGTADHLEIPAADTERAPGGPGLILPLVGSGAVLGVLSLIRLRGRPAFTAVDLELATGFASQATLALELSEARLHQQRKILLEDRDRIARDLHDHVIQRLFATGLSVESIAKSLGGAGSGPVPDQLLNEVGEIDAIIRELRSSILRLRGSLAVGEPARADPRATTAVED